MTTMVTNEEIKDILEIALDRELDEFSMDANWYADYQMDSLAAVALVVEVQQRFGIRIPDGRMPRVQTGEQLRATIEEISAMTPEEREELLKAEAEISQEVMDEIAAGVRQAAEGASTAHGGAAK